MFQSLSLTNELDARINKYKEIEHIIASCDKNHGVQNDIIKDCIKLPCWRKYNDNNIYIIGLSNDVFDNYWLCCYKKPPEHEKEVTSLNHFKEYGFYFISCLSDVFAKYPEVESHIKIWTEEEKKLLHDDTIWFFENTNGSDHLLYLAI